MTDEEREDIMFRDLIKKKVYSGMLEVGEAKHMWIATYGESAEPKIDMMIEEATKEAESLVPMSEEEFQEHCRMRIEAEFEDVVNTIKESRNERRETGDYKERLS